MAATTTIKLSKPLQDHGGPVHAVVLREPRFEEYRELGDPYLIAQTPDGVPYVVEKTEVLRQYEEQLIVEPQNSAILTQGDWRLARDIRQAVLRFFLPVAEEGEASTTSQTTSSSTAASGPSTSNG